MTNKASSGMERRKYIRIDSQNILKCKMFTIEDLGGDVDQDKIKAVTKNISAGGVLFESRKKYSVGELLKMEIDILGWEKFKSEFLKDGEITSVKPLVVLASIVRVEVVEPETTYDIGVCFSAIDDGHRWALMKYIKQENQRN